MLASIVASKTARLIATCVCPVVGAGTLTMAVPKVRNAVHRATAPHEYALPKTRERAVPVSIVAPCTTIGATPLGTGFPDVVPAAFPRSMPDGKVPLPTGPILALGPDLKPKSPGLPPAFGGPGNPGNPDTPPVVPGTPGFPGVGGVPEPHTWLQLLVGFTLIGGAVRMTRKQPTEEEQELLDRVEELRTDARL